MATIYENGTEFDIALFELMKAHPEVKEVKVKRFEDGKNKGNIKTEITYDDGK